MFSFQVHLCYKRLSVPIESNPLPLILFSEFIRLLASVREILPTKRHETAGRNTDRSNFYRAGFDRKFDHYGWGDLELEVRDPIVIKERNFPSGYLLRLR